MIESNAIERIEQLVTAAGKPETDIPAAFVPSGTEVKSLESLQDAPARMRQRYRTERIPDFVTYVSQHASEGDASTVYVKPDGSKASGIIDHGDTDKPRWGDHRATLELRETAAFSALDTLARSRVDQQAFIDYLEDWSGEVDAVRGDEVLPKGRAIAAVRRCEIKSSSSSTHEVGDFVASKSAFADIEAKGAAESMPTHLVLREPVYVGTEPREIVAKIGIVPHDDAPAFRLRILGMERIREEIAAEVEERLRKELKGVDVFVGEVSR